VAETYFPFDSGQGANVAEASWRKMAKLWTPTGVLFNELSQLGLYGDSSGMQVKVRTGRASMWEIGLGTVTVPAGATTIAAADVTADTKLTPLGTGIVSTTETTTSTVYGNLATVGPDVHIEVSDASAALVTITSRIQCDTAGQHAFMGFELSGSQSVAAGDATALAVPGANMAFRLSASYVVTGLARGGYRFRGRYRVTGGTGTFSQRSLIVTPL
jgi:hypothetical protein